MDARMRRNIEMRAEDVANKETRRRCYGEAERCAGCDTRLYFAYGTLLSDPIVCEACDPSRQRWTVADVEDYE